MTSRAKRKKPRKLFDPKSAIYVLLAFFAVRSLLNCFLLEYNNDEGTWLWNARVDSLNLPSYGLYQSALTPFSYFFHRFIFLVTGPSIEAVRIGQVLVLNVAVFLLCKRLIETKRALGAFTLASWFCIDPTLFRVTSWAFLEPLLLALVIAAYLAYEHEKDGLPWTAGVTGFFVGLAFAVKITSAWLAFGFAVNYFFLRRYKKLLWFFAAALLPSLLYVWFYWNDTIRFAEIWRYHTAGRVGLGQGIIDLLRNPLPEEISCVGITAACVTSLFFRSRQKFQGWGMAAGLLLGIGYLLNSPYSPARYWLPVVLFSLLLFANHWRQQSLAWLKQPALSVALLVVMGANFTYYRLLWWPLRANQTRMLAGIIARHADNDEVVVAPASLSFDTRKNVIPGSVGDLTISPAVNTPPDLFVHQKTAAIDSAVDGAVLELFRNAGISPSHHRFFDLYRRQP